MVDQALIIISAVFASVVKWFDDIISALGAGPLIIVALVTVFAVGIVLEPLRGSMDMHFTHYTKNSTHKSSNYKYRKKGD